MPDFSDEPRGGREHLLINNPQDPDVEAHSPFSPQSVWQQQKCAELDLSCMCCSHPVFRGNAETGSIMKQKAKTINYCRFI